MDLALFVVTVVVTTYWGSVPVLVLYHRLRHGHRAGIVPRQPFERRLWLALVPVCACWLILPWLGLALPWLTEAPPAGLGLPAWAVSSPVMLGLRWTAATLAVLCYLLSLACWLTLGTSWSMAVVPGQGTRLVTTGPYRWARHPIYALGMMLMLSTAVALPTLPMMVVAVAHLIVLNLKAWHEEEHLGQQFGTDYASYCRQVGRFWPRWTRG